MKQYGVRGTKKVEESKSQLGNECTRFRLGSEIALSAPVANKKSGMVKLMFNYRYYVPFTKF